MHMTILGLLTIGAIGLVSCGTESFNSGDTRLDTDFKNGDTRLNSDRDIKQDINSTSDEEPNYILIHGGGPYWLANMQRFAGFIEGRGISSDRIIELQYQYDAELDDINADLIAQFNDPEIADNPHVVITHSLGDFVGLRALLGSDALATNKKFVSMAGVANGQTRRPITQRCTFCAPYILDLHPYQNDFVQDVWGDYEDELAEIDHCALYSTRDRLVNNPYDSGVFPDSTVAEYNDLTHINFIRRDFVLNRISDDCDMEWK